MNTVFAGISVGILNCLCECSGTRRNFESSCAHLARVYCIQVQWICFRL